MSGWPRQVFNAMDEFKNDFRCITMDQRNANGGESTGPVQVNDPWGAFADDQLGLLDHLGIREFFFIGYCIGGHLHSSLWNGRPSASWPPSSASQLGTRKRRRTPCMTPAMIAGAPNYAPAA